MANTKKPWLKRLEERVDRAWGYDISTPKARRRAKRHFNWIDHGILRTFWFNFHEIAPGVFRSNQPSPKRLAEFKQMGVKTVISLRGNNPRSPHLFETEACENLDLTYETVRLHARSLANRNELLNLLKLFETIEKPFVFHCKSGADRAGLASYLYLLHMTDTVPAVARKQFSLKYLHIKSSSTGILDHMIDAYEQDFNKSQISIREWIKTQYNPTALTQSYGNDGT